MLTNKNENITVLLHGQWKREKKKEDWDSKRFPNISHLSVPDKKENQIKKSVANVLGLHH